MKLRGYLVTLALWLIAGFFIVHVSDQWAMLHEDSRISVWSERVLYEKPGQHGFYVHVKIHNETSGMIGIDFRDHRLVFDVDGWGMFDGGSSRNFDEAAAAQKNLDSGMKADLLKAYQNGNVSYVSPRESFDYYVHYDSPGSNRPDIDKRPGQFLGINIGGQMFLSNGTDVWDELVKNQFTIATPVTWKALPGSAFVIERQ